MQRKTFLLRTLALLSAVVCASIVFPVHGASTDRHTSRACAEAKGNSSSAAAASATTQSSATGTKRDGTADASRRAASPSRGMSSSVTSGPNGLSSTTTMPDGSTVSVGPGQPGTRPSVATSRSSAGSGGMSSGARAGTDDDCIEPGARGSARSNPRHKNGKQLQSQKENR